MQAPLLTWMPCSVRRRANGDGLGENPSRLLEGVENDSSCSLKPSNLKCLVDPEHSVAAVDPEINVEIHDGFGRLTKNLNTMHPQSGRL